ncbi:hypothetical protein [Luteolibacter soli]|uniref:HEAT repeat domain-containing protein n=1 Tax=Luteolibacter soli TaxID=3135280 RepID=A0ABU9AR29_9BACT
MKPKFTLLFGLIALGGLALIAVQRREILSLRAEAVGLEAKLPTLSHHRPANPEVADASPSPVEAEPVAGSGINWDEALLIVKGSSRSVADGIILQKQIAALSPEGFLKALDELDARELPEDSKMNLARLFLGGLVKANPRLAVERLGKYADLDHQMAPRLGAAMEAWVKQDSGAALAWLDRWVASNPVYDRALSRISPGRVVYESAVIKVMLSQKPDLLAARVSAMPREEAVRLLTTVGWDGPEAGEQFTYAELVRKTLPEAEGSQVLGSKAKLLAQSSLEEASGYLDRIHPTGEELKVCLSGVVESRMESKASDPDLGNEIKTVREWVTARNPAQADTLTGVAFGHALNGRDLDFDEVAPVVMQFHDAAGNDEILHAFLKNGGCCHGSKSLELAAKIADPAIREEVVRHINNHH